MPTKFTLTIGDDTLKEMEALATIGGRTINEELELALATYLYLKMDVVRGNRVYIQGKDGKHKEIVL